MSSCILSEGGCDSSSNCFWDNQMKNQFLVSLEKCDANTFFYSYIHTTALRWCHTQHHEGPLHEEVPPVEQQLNPYQCWICLLLNIHSPVMLHPTKTVILSSWDHFPMLSFSSLAICQGIKIRCKQLALMRHAWTCTCMEKPTDVRSNGMLCNEQLQ